MKKIKNYKDIRPDPIIDYEPGERIRIFSKIDFDPSVFRKSNKERRRLKEAKRLNNETAKQT